MLTLAQIPLLAMFLYRDWDFLAKTHSRLVILYHKMSGSSGLAQVFPRRVWWQKQFLFFKIFQHLATETEDETSSSDIYADNYNETFLQC